MHIEKYSHVMHIVSHVSGELAKDKTCYDAFRSVFPAGTVSGAPKVCSARALPCVFLMLPGIVDASIAGVATPMFSGVASLFLHVWPCE